MEFTKKGYSYLLHQLRTQGYQFRGFTETDYSENTVILRHDIDFSLKAAVELSDLEAKLNVPSTWFVLVNTEFYNIHATAEKENLQRILKNGGTIGLHFDARQYPLDMNQTYNLEDYQMRLNASVQQEADILENVIHSPVRTVAFHCPSQQIIAMNIHFENMVNAYSDLFFRKFKYVSDSRMHWRENIDEYIKNKKYSKLQILTHAFWYPVSYQSMSAHLKKFCNDAMLERYDILEKNFDHLNDVLNRCELSGGVKNTNDYNTRNFGFFTKGKNFISVYRKQNRNNLRIFLLRQISRQHNDLGSRCKKII